MVAQDPKAIASEGSLKFRTVIHIERIAIPTAATFRELARENQPFVLAGLCDGWPARRWTPSYLTRVLGDQQVPVYRLPATETSNTLPPTGDRRSETIAFDEFIGKCIADDEPDKFYLAQCRDIEATYPRIARDLRRLDILDGQGQGVLQSNLWIGTAGVGIGLHNDSALANVLCQFVGRKRAVLIPPKYIANVYPYPIFSKTSGAHSQVRDIDNPDTERFPLFLHAPAYVTVLEPGDALFIPSFWWHGLTTIDFGVSANFFHLPDHLDAAQLKKVGAVFTQIENLFVALSEAPVFYRDLMSVRLANLLSTGQAFDGSNGTFEEFISAYRSNYSRPRTD